MALYRFSSRFRSRGRPEPAGRPICPVTALVGALVGASPRMRHGLRLAAQGGRPLVRALAACLAAARRGTWRENRSDTEPRKRPNWLSPSASCIRMRWTGSLRKPLRAFEFF